MRILIPLILSGAFACKSTGCQEASKPGAQDAPQSSDASTSPIIPPDARLSAITIRYGSFFDGMNTYTFDPSTLVLKATWIRGDATGKPGRAERRTSIGEFEWALVHDHLRVLKPLALDDSACGQLKNGPERHLTVDYKSQGVAKTATIASASAMKTRCATHYMSDQNFQAVLDGVQKKLPQPTDDASYEAIPAP